ATSTEPAHRYSSVTEFVDAFAGDMLDPVVVPQRRITRVNLSRRAWVAASLVLVLAVVGSRPAVRQTLHRVLPVDWSLFGGDQAEEEQSSDLPDSGSVTPSAGRRSNGDLARGRRRTGAKGSSSGGTS